MSDNLHSWTVERLYELGKHILRSSADGKLDEQRKGLRDHLNDAVMDCYRHLVPGIISLGELKNILQPVEKAGWSLLAPGISQEEEQRRFNEFANCLDIDLHELRVVAGGLDGAALPEGDEQPVRRGRRPQSDQQRDREIASGWERAKGAGTTKKQFARDQSVSFRELNRILNRYAKRRQRAAH